MSDRAFKFVSGDRFIPKRAGANFEASHYFLNATRPASPEIKVTGNPRHVNTAYLKWKNRLYQDRLWSVLAPGSTKILNFSDANRMGVNGYFSCPLWPVKARKQPLIDAPSMVLDMPDLEGNICHHTIDWGSQGYLASVFEREIYLWHGNSTSSYKATKTQGRVDNCVRWNRSGKIFAIALNNSGIALWDCTKNQILHETVCSCTSLCAISCLEWSLTDLLVSGCSLGKIIIWSSCLVVLKTIPQAHYGTIITIALSCNERYLATTSTDCSVRIWFWPDIKENFEINYPTPVRGLAWHPWRDSFFAAGGNIGDGSLTVWNASNHSIIGCKSSPDKFSHFIDALAWNSLTGELTVSYWNQTASLRKNSIVVLKNLDAKVDEIEWHQGRVLYLMWGVDGTQLATAGTDENLCVWDFVGKSPEVIKRYKKTSKKRTFIVDSVQNLALFGQIIR